MSKVNTVGGIILYVLEDNVFGLSIDQLIEKCGFKMHPDAVEMNIRQLARRGKIFSWQGRFYHSKYRDDKERAKKVAADIKKKKAKLTLKQVKSQVVKDIDKKIDALDDIIRIVQGDVGMMLVKIRNNLKFIADADL